MNRIENGQRYLSCEASFERVTTMFFDDLFLGNAVHSSKTRLPPPSLTNMILDKSSDVVHEKISICDVPRFGNGSP